MALECLESYIGYKGLCGDSVPNSGLYVNDLPGYWPDKLEYLSDPETADIQGVWTKIYNRACDMLAVDVVSLNADKLTVKSVLDNVIGGRYEKTFDQEDASAFRKGQKVKAWGSRYLDFVLNDVRLYMVAGGAVTLSVFDLQTGIELWTDSYTGVTGHNVFQVDEIFKTNGDTKRLFVCYDATTIDSYKTISGDQAGGNGARKYWSITGASISTGGSVLEDNLTTDCNSGGLIVNFNLVCNSENIVCQYRDVLKYALRHRAAIEWMNEVIRGGQKVNNLYTLMDRDLAKENRDEMIAEYNQMLMNVAGGISLDEDGVCVDCNAPVKLVYSLP